MAIWLWYFGPCCGVRDQWSRNQNFRRGLSSWLLYVAFLFDHNFHFPAGGSKAQRLRQPIGINWSLLISQQNPLRYPSHLHKTSNGIIFFHRKGSLHPQLPPFLLDFLFFRLFWFLIAAHLNRMNQLSATTMKSLGIDLARGRMDQPYGTDIVGHMLLLRDLYRYLIHLQGSGAKSAMSSNGTFGHPTMVDAKVLLLKELRQMAES